MIRWDAAVDVVVVASGVAGLTAAHDCAAAGLRVVVLTKDSADAGSTAWAQGGIAVVDEATGDSLAEHVADTVVAGAGLTDPAVAQAIVTEGVFNIRGIGGLVFRGILQQDTATVVGIVVLLVVVYLIANLVVDLLYAVLDPRIRYD